MTISNRRIFMCGACICFLLAATADAQRATPGRALAIEDYYEIPTVGSPQISPNGRWVTFTVATRIERDNSTRTEVYVVPSDASAAARRVQHYGRNVSDASWTDDNRLQYAANGQ